MKIQKFSLRAVSCCTAKHRAMTHFLSIESPSHSIGSKVVRCEDIVPLDNRYYLIQLMGSKKVQHFIGRAEQSKNKDGLYWMQFLKKTEEPGKFSFKKGDCGGVTSGEIIAELDNPMDDLTSSYRSGKVIFSLNQLAQYQGTLN